MRPKQGCGRREGTEEVAKAAGGGYCRLQILLKLALAVRGTVAGHRLGALLGGPPPKPPNGASSGQGSTGPAIQGSLGAQSAVEYAPLSWPSDTTAMAILTAPCDTAFDEADPRGRRCSRRPSVLPTAPGRTVVRGRWALPAAQPGVMPPPPPPPPHTHTPTVRLQTFLSRQSSASRPL